jgi:hypothetical protein
MANSFDHENINTVEFGVCIDTDDGEKYFLIPIDESVKAALMEMLASTRVLLEKHRLNGDYETYQPSEKYGSIEGLKYPINSSTNQKLKELYESSNINTNPSVLNDPEEIIFYYGIFHDNTRNSLLAIKKANQFRGIVKSGNFVVRLLNETLKLLEDKIFKLDKDFDYFVSDDIIYILRPSAFEYTSDMDTFLLAKAVEHANDLSRTITFLECSNLADYVSGHKRAARLLASIRSRSDLRKTKIEKFKKECKKNKIEFITKSGKISPAPGHEIKFLLLLDRRMYALALTDDGDELYEATSRKQAK